MIRLPFYLSLSFRRGRLPWQKYDVSSRRTIYDGSGGTRSRQTSDHCRQIVKIGDLSRANAATTIENATGWRSHRDLSTCSRGRPIDHRRSAFLSAIEAGRHYRDLWRRLVDGPAQRPMKKQVKERSGRISFDVAWTTLAESAASRETRAFRRTLRRTSVRRPFGCTFLGRATCTDCEQMQQMRDLVAKEMPRVHSGIGSSLIYAPAFYAKRKNDRDVQVRCEVQGKYIRICSEATGSKKQLIIDPHLA